MATRVQSEADIAPGDYYKDCGYHPCLCIRVLGDEVSGVSLADGSFPRNCPVAGCGIRKLSFEEAVYWRFRGPPDAEVPVDKRGFPASPRWASRPKDRGPS